MTHLIGITCTCSLKLTVQYSALWEYRPCCYRLTATYRWHSPTLVGPTLQFIIHVRRPSRNQGNFAHHRALCFATSNENIVCLPCHVWGLDNESVRVAAGLTELGFGFMCSTLGHVDHHGPPIHITIAYFHRWHQRGSIWNLPVLGLLEPCWWEIFRGLGKISYGLSIG